MISRFDNLKHPGYLNESVADTQQPVNTLVRQSPALVKTVSGIITSPPSRSGLINAPWSYAVRYFSHFKNFISFKFSVLIYWCCTNRVCVYKDQLKDFCNRVVNAHYAYHVNKSLQSYANHEEINNEADAEDLYESAIVIKPFPIRKDTKKRR